MLVGSTVASVAQPAMACSVCFGGDANDAMNQGVRAGVLVLLGVAGGVLTGLAGLMIFWVRRASQLRRQAVDSG